MSTFEDELRQRQHFLRKTEALIREANLEVIDPLIPTVTEDVIVQFARAVAKLRGRYLEAVFKLTSTLDESPPADADVDRVRQYRAVYEEARKGFEELTHAVERGYLSLGK